MSKIWFPRVIKFGGIFMEIISVTTKLDGKIVHWNLSVIMAINLLHMLGNYTAWAKKKIDFVCTYSTVCTCGREKMIVSQALL
jgi:hypothetical protein